VDDRFVTLASLVASAAPPARPGGVQTRVPAPSAPATPVNVAHAVLDTARADIAQELALVRLAALEAFERASTDLLSRLAHDVLARELRVAPVDLAALTARALASFAEHEPVALVVAPGDVGSFESTLPVRGDATLDVGDLVVEVRDGSFETRFAMRVNETVAATAAQSAR
jgi:hypothetical protein